MNQREALAILVIDVREHEPEDKQVLRALKWADKRLQTLQDREDRRKVPFPSDEDLISEPMVISIQEGMADLEGNVCRGCGKKKRKRQSFCTSCYIAIPDPAVKKSLWRQHLYFRAFNWAVRILKELRGAQ